MDTYTLNVIIIVVAALMAWLTVRYSYFKILKIAKDKDLVDNPDARKLQKTPVPVMGGIAVFIGIVAGMLAGMVLNYFFGQSDLHSLLPILWAMMIMLYTGAMDDIIGLTPRSRFIIEILTVLGVVYASGSCID